MMGDADDELFRLEDFHSVQVVVSVENQTTKTAIHDETRVLGGVEVPVEHSTGMVRLMELSDRGISLDVPYRTAAPGHILDCTLDVSGVSFPLFFKMRCRVLQSELLEGERERLDLELLEAEDRYFTALKKLFSNRQLEIDEFLKRVKG